jgi:hypothetical protein
MAVIGEITVLVVYYRSMLLCATHCFFGRINELTEVLNFMLVAGTAIFMLSVMLITAYSVIGGVLGVVISIWRLFR